MKKAAIIRLEKWARHMSGLRQMAREADEMRENRRAVVEPLLTIVDEAGVSYVDVELTSSEWGAIRRYLLRNRLRRLEQEMRND
jgi:hypothetical protein